MTSIRADLALQLSQRFGQAACIARAFPPALPPETFLDDRPQRSPGPTLALLRGAGKPQRALTAGATRCRRSREGMPYQAYFVVNGFSVSTGKTTKSRVSA